jgi:tetratricopeptide (TPR) repeat protein
MIFCEGMKSCRSLIVVWTKIFWLFLLTGLLPATNTSAQSQCRTELAEAESRYREGRFEETIAIVNRCLDKGGMTEEERKQAYRLLGKTYIAKDYLDEAREAIKRLLELVPNFEADPVQDPPTFTEMVKDVKNELEKTDLPPPPLGEIPEKKNGGSKKWLLLGGVVLAGGAAAILLSGGTDGPAPSAPSLPLPAPPSFP